MIPKEPTNISAQLLIKRGCEWVLAAGNALGLKVFPGGKMNLVGYQYASGCIRRSGE